MTLRAFDERPRFIAVFVVDSAMKRTELDRNKQKGGSRISIIGLAKMGTRSKTC